MAKTSNLLRCYVCDSETIAFPEFRRCQSCGTVRTLHDYNPAIYDVSYAKNYCGYAENGVNVSLQLFRLGLVSRWLRQGDAILDVGCCIGEFIRFAEQYYPCYGYEPNPEAVRMSRGRVKSPVTSNFLPRLEFKAVTLFDVIEHMEYPRVFLKDIQSRLSQDGILVITTPTVDIFEKREVSEVLKWKHWKPAEHLFLYTEDGLSRLLSQMGFKVIHVGHEESDIRPGNPRGDILTVVTRKEK